jgi:hypothetical protein
MKKAILIFLFAINITPAHANEIGGWVKVNANGAVISGTIVCTPDVCGDPNSEYSKDTLLPGESYVQIVRATSDGNVAGPNVPLENNNQIVTVKANAENNLATIVRKSVEEVSPGITVIKQQETTYDNEQSSAKIIAKEASIKIEQIVIKEDPSFLNWLNVLNQLLFDWLTNFTWAWDL